jgi:penicillin-binding protein 1C
MSQNQAGSIQSATKERKLNLLSKIVFFILFLGFIIRLAPYFAPIRAKDILQKDRAFEFSDRNGLPLGTILTKDREHTAVVPLESVSPHFIHAIIAAEDKGFYHHGALDLKAIARSFWQVYQHRRLVSGASTITMQLARMLEPAPRTITAKVQEIWLSWRLTAGMNKDQILEAYFNRLPMGSNIYGVEAASRIYFGIPASELNLAQASILAAIPNNPNYLNPYYYWQNLKNRQKYVLDRLVKDGYISQAQSQKAIEEKIALRSRQQGIISAPHFLFWLTKQQGKGDREQGTGNTSTSSVHRREQGTENREQGNLLNKYEADRIRTTIDRPLQQFVETQVKQVVQNLKSQNVHHSAALVIDNHTGEVLAYVGSPDYFAGDTLSNNDGVQALRQPGSTLKPFLYQLALEKRFIRPNTILADVPTHYGLPGGKLYSPTDYNESYAGAVLPRIALANSLNIPAIRTLEKVGVSTFLDRLQQLGFEHLNKSPEYYGLGLTLGSGEVSLWELARAYVTLARQGSSIPLVTTLSGGKAEGRRSREAEGLRRKGAEGQRGRGAEEKIQSDFSVLSPDTWSIVTDILSDRYARARSFGVDSVLNLPFPTAVKTGTSSNFRDTWTVGFSSDYTVATWVGNFQGQPMQKVSGVMGAAPLWARIMLHLHEHREAKSLPTPDRYLKRPVCAVSGLKPSPTCSAVVGEYFAPEDLPEYEKVTSSSLSREYDRWLVKQPQTRSYSGEFKIISPNLGDRFLLYPHSDRQKLEFKVTTTADTPIEWWLNGQKIATQKTNSLYWKLTPGNWTLEVRKGNQSDRVNFQVDFASVRSAPRGFSVIPKE